MRPAIQRVDDCVRAVLELYRVYGIPTRELSYVDLARIINIAYTITGFIISGKHPEFYIETYTAVRTGERLPDTFFYPVGARWGVARIAARYLSPQEWTRVVYSQHHGAYAYSPVFTVWGGFYSDLAAPPANPTENTVRVPILPPMYHGGVYVYYYPTSEPIVVEYISLPGLIQPGPNFLSQPLKIPPADWDVFVHFVAVLGLLLLGITAGAGVEKIVQQALDYWRLLGAGIEQVIGSLSLHNPSVPVIPPEDVQRGEGRQ